MSKIKKFWPVFLIIFLVLVFFWKFFFKGLLPIPADITVGMYYPWLDYKWGFPAGVPVKNPLISDVPSLVYPWRLIVIESFRKGIFPLWNPYYFSGMPLLANFQSAPFSLDNIFFVFLPTIYAWSAGVIIQPFLAALFAYLYLRHLKIRKLAAFLGGTIFAFSGFSTVWLEYNVLGHAAMWLPILLLVTDKIIEEKRIKWILLGSFVLAFQIFAGYPQIVLYSLTVVVFYMFFRRSLSWRVALFVLLGLLLASVQLLSGLEALQLSVRPIGPVAKSLSEGFLPWRNLVTILAPDFFGNPATFNFWGVPWYDNFALYTGVLPFLLAILAVFWRRDSLSRFFAFLLIFSLIIALPTPIAKLVDKLGIYGMKAIPARIIFLLDFSMAILAALGLDWLLKTKKSLNHLYKIGVLIFLIILGIFTGVFVSRQIIFNSLSQFYEGPGLDFISQWLINLRVSLRNLILPLGLSFTAASIFWLLRFKFLKRVLILLYIFFIVFELFRFGWKYLPFSQKEFVFPTTPAIDFLQNEKKNQLEPFRVEFDGTIPQNMWVPYGLESAAGYDAMAPFRYSQFLGALRKGQISKVCGRVSRIESYQSPLFDLLNIKYLLVVKNDEEKETKFKLGFEDKSVQVYENLEVLSRAFLVHNFVVKKEDQEIVDQLIARDFDLSNSVVLEEEISLEKKNFNASNDSVSFVEYHPQKSVIKTFSEAEGLLFLGDSFYSGWKAYVDGEETKIYRANFAFQAVKVPAGEHRVRFVYNPPLFRWGLFISLGTLIIILAEVGVVFFTKIAPRIITKVAKPLKL